MTIAFVRLKVYYNIIKRNTKPNTKRKVKKVNTMATYMIKAMSIDNYYHYMGGGYASPSIIQIEANDKEEAVQIAKKLYDNHYIWDDAITKEEYEQLKKEIEGWEEEYERKEAERKQKAEDKKNMKIQLFADENNISFEDAKEYLRIETNIKRNKSENRRDEKKIEEIEREIKQREAKIKRMEKMLEKILKGA